MSTIFEEVLKLFNTMSLQDNLVQFTQTYSMQNQTKEIVLDTNDFFLIVC